MRSSQSPLVGAPPGEVSLKSAPLLRVIAQLRFPVIASLDRADFIAPFQEMIRSEFPVLRSEVASALTAGADSSARTVWRFYDESGGWRLSLARDFLALETLAYTSRGDFLDRLKRALSSAQEHLGLTIHDRLGIRYIDRIQGEDLQDLSRFLHPEVAGVLSSSIGAQAERALSETVFALTDEPGEMLARWGLVPSNCTVDPHAIEPIDGPSWILDLDAYDSRSQAFEVDTVVSRIEDYAERIYAFFRWAITDEFLKRYGGEL